MYACYAGAQILNIMNGGHGSYAAAELPKM